MTCFLTSLRIIRNVLYLGKTSQKKRGCRGKLPLFKVRWMCDKGNKKFRKRAKSKYITNGLVRMLTRLNSVLRPAYLNSFFCNQILMANDGKLVGTYCKNRWCLTCNRNRIGKLINGYGDQLKALNDPYFVTLTAKTVPADELATRIDNMVVAWRRIHDNARKRKRVLKGVRKLECTARPGDLYHPHFHLIIDGKDNAAWVIKQWLGHWGEQAKRISQDMRPADSGSVIELFKYFTKLITKTHSENLFLPKAERQFMRVDMLDKIFIAMRNRQVYTAFGGISPVSEEVDEISVIASNYDDGTIFKYVGHDWFDTNNGEALTGWIPSEQVNQLINIKNVKNDYDKASVF